MIKEKVNSKNIKSIVYIAIFLSVIALVISGYGLTIEGPQGPQGPQGLQGEQGLQGIPGEGDSYSLDAYGGSILDVLFVNYNANVGIGTLDPNEKLEVNGSIKISGDYKYNSSKTCYLNVPSVAFHQLPTESLDDDIYGYYDGLGYIEYDTKPYNINIYTPVFLPDGAKVTNFSVYYFDEEEDYDMQIDAYLRNNSLGEHDPERMANVDLITLDEEVGYDYDKSIRFNIIDNENYHYYISVYMEIEGGESTSLGFEGCRIEYTLDTIN